MGRGRTEKRWRRHLDLVALDPHAQNRLEQVRRDARGGSLHAIRELERASRHGVPEDRHVARTPGRNYANSPVLDPVPSSTRPLSPPRDGSPRPPWPADNQPTELVCDVVRHEVRPGDVIEAFRDGGVRWKIRVELLIHDEVIGILLKSSADADVLDRRVCVPARMVTVRRGRVLTFPPPATG